ncbi:MAG: G5 domain-containing protein [Oscillospiraceae bacterium]
MKFSLQNKFVKLAVLVAFVLTVALLTGFLYLKDSVYITDNGVTRQIKTNETNTHEILRAENIIVGEFDSVTESVDENNSLHITIERAFDVFVTADGSTATYTVLDGTVRDILDYAEITLGDYDKVSVRLDSQVYAGMEVEVTRIEHVERTVDTVIAFETEYIDNSNRAIGYEKVVTKGADGLARAVYDDIYVNGVLQETELVSEEYAEYPVTEVIERGTACAVPYAKMDDPTALKLVNGIPESYTRVITGKSTAYSARAGAKTASGRNAVVGTVAVNPNVIPYGSELYIVSTDRKYVYGYAIAADTGSGMMEGYSMIDLFTASYGDACKWGSHIVDVFVITEGNG